METTIKLSIQDRIEQVAIAYVQSHYDVKSMSPVEFLQAVNQVENQLNSLVNQK